MENNLSIQDIERLIKINQEEIREYERKKQELAAENAEYLNLIEKKRSKKITQIIKIVKDQGWNDTSIHVSVVGVGDDCNDLLHVYSNERISWNERKQISNIIDAFIERYPHIKEIVSCGYPMPKKIKDKYSALEIKETT